MRQRHFHSSTCSRNMADNLDEEWWQQNGKEEKHKVTKKSKKSSVKDTEVHKSEKDKKSKKKSEPSPNNDEATSETEAATETKATKRKLPPVEVDVIKKKRRKKTITKELATGTATKNPKEEFLTVLNTYLEEKFLPLQREELQIDETDIIQLTLNDEGSWAQSLQTEFPKMLEKLKRNVKECGSPITLVLAASALRILDLKRDLETLTPESKIPKLFAKHIKMKEQCTFLNKNIVKIAVGTPHRVSELIDADALSIDLLRYIIIDWSFRDEKQRRAIDLAEIRAAAMQLFTKHLLIKVKSVKTKIVLV